MSSRSRAPSAWWPARSANGLTGGGSARTWSVRSQTGPGTAFTPLPGDGPDVQPAPVQAREDREGDGGHEGHGDDQPFERAAVMIWIDPEDDLDPVLPQQGQQEEHAAEGGQGGFY